ncbi:MAG TPA: adenylyltransferase/cytidyltransferase family protein [Tenuifilaceae bacterium]|nr:adenylyltransferase/cytidyltransferase family protein [Tenuifilaceae bacterium]HRX31582.1 adenylyltransferase/cytidyltransferase family protein [Tenuifilaceae bacterium]
MEKQEILNRKILLTREELSRKVAYWNFKNRDIVALYGSFDVFHPSVFKLINYAAEKGKELVVGIKPDAKIKNEKGPKFPVYNQDIRSKMVASHQFVSAVYICNEGLDDFLRLVKPTVASCCKHASKNDQKGLEIVKEWNGKVSIFTGSDTSVDDIISKYKE